VEQGSHPSCSVASSFEGTRDQAAADDPAGASGFLAKPAFLAWGGRSRTDNMGRPLT